MKWYHISELLPWRWAVWAAAAQTAALPMQQLQTRNTQWRQHCSKLSHSQRGLTAVWCQTQTLWKGLLICRLRSWDSQLPHDKHRPAWSESCNLSCSAARLCSGCRSQTSMVTPGKNWPATAPRREHRMAVNHRHQLPSFALSPQSQNSAQTLQTARGTGAPECSS